MSQPDPNFDVTLKQLRSSKKIYGRVSIDENLVKPSFEPEDTASESDLDPEPDLVPENSIMPLSDSDAGELEIVENFTGKNVAEKVALSEAWAELDSFFTVSSTSMKGVDLTDQCDGYFNFAKAKTYRWPLAYFLSIFDYMMRETDMMNSSKNLFYV